MSTNYLLYCLRCDLFTVSVLVSPGRCLALLMHRMQQKRRWNYRWGLLNAFSVYNSVRNLEHPLRKLLHSDRRPTFPIYLLKLPPPTEVRVHRWPVSVPYHLSAYDWNLRKHFLSSIVVWYCWLLKKKTSSSTTNIKQWSNIVHIQSCPPFSASLACCSILCALK